jgi:hypothetical protein
VHCGPGELGREPGGAARGDGVVGQPNGQRGVVAGRGGGARLPQGPDLSGTVHNVGHAIGVEHPLDERRGGGALVELAAGLDDRGGQVDGDLALRDRQLERLLQRVGGEVTGAQPVAGTLVAAAQRDGQRQVGQPLGVRRRLPAQPLERLDGLAQPALRLQSARPAEAGVRREHGVLLVGGLHDLREALGGDGRIAMLELQLGVTQPELGVDALPRLDPVQEELGGAPQALGQESGYNRSRSALTRLDERDITVRQVGSGQLGLGHPPVQPQSADAVTDGSLTRHLISQGGEGSTTRNDCMK